MVHHTTQERPIDRFKGEQPYLTPLPPGRFVSIREELRKVSWDRLISFGGSRYSGPYQYASKEVWVRTSQGATIQVYSQRGELMATHPLSQRKGVTTLVEDHYAGLRKAVTVEKNGLGSSSQGKWPLFSNTTSLDPLTLV